MSEFARNLVRRAHGGQLGALEQVRPRLAPVFAPVVRLARARDVVGSSETPGFPASRSGDMTLLEPVPEPSGELVQRQPAASSLPAAGAMVALAPAAVPGTADMPARSETADGPAPAGAVSPPIIAHPEWATEAADGPRPAGAAQPRVTTDAQPDADDADSPGPVGSVTTPATRPDAPTGNSVVESTADDNDRAGPPVMPAVDPPKKPHLAAEVSPPQYLPSTAAPSVSEPAAPPTPERAAGVVYVPVIHPVSPPPERAAPLAASQLRPRAKPDPIRWPLLPSAETREAESPSIEVRIGTVEITAEAPPAEPPRRPRSSGFDEYLALRNYETWDLQ